MYLEILYSPLSVLTLFHLRGRMQRKSSQHRFLLFRSTNSLRVFYHVFSEHWLIEGTWSFMYISGGDHPIGAYPMDCDSNGGKKWKLSPLSIPGSWKNLCFNQSLLLFQNTWGLSKMFFSYTLKETWQLTAVNQFQPNYKSSAWQRKPKCLKAASASLPC